MLDFLIDTLNKDEIDYLKNNLYQSEKFNLNCNQENVIEIIKYLKSLGFTNILDLIVNRIELFFNNIDFVKEKIPSNINLKIIEKINENYLEIDTILDL